MSNILITGAAGFIGSAVTNYFVQNYPESKIYGLDKISYCSSLKNLNESKEKSNFKFIKGDILEINFLDFIFSEYSINSVIHFAAYSHVDHSFGNSVIFTQNNVVGTHNLLEVAKKYKVKRFIHVSTDEVYGNQEGHSDEKSILNPTNPYSSTKAAAEQLVNSYYHSFKLPIIITRGNNVYGPMQYPEKVIPRFCMRLLRGEKCQIQGSGQQTRSFLYIDDVVNAFNIIYEKGEIGQIYNIGSHEEISIRNLAEMMSKKITKEELIEYIKDRDFNDQRYLISHQKLTELGWSAKVGIEEGLQKTIDWYRNNMDYWADHELEHCLDGNVVRRVN